MIYIYILLAILLFGALIAVHEFGHFITAKLSGVRVNEFAIGMGPAIFKKKLGETLYALRILPFGGYCAMEGEDSDSEDPRAFSQKPVLVRMLIVVAGSAMNLIAGFIVLAIFLAPVKEWQTTTLKSIATSEALPENSVHPGDTITRIDGYNIYLFNDIFIALSRNENGYHEIEVERGGKTVVLQNSGMSQREEGDSSGAVMEFETEKTSFWGKTKYIFQNGVNLIRLVKLGITDLFSGSVSKDDISGPIGIGEIMVDTAKTDMMSLLYLLAFISVNLGIMNLLPLPALDGGRFIFLLAELIIGKRVPAKYEGYVHAIGLIILLGLMAFITFNDISKIFMN